MAAPGWENRRLCDDGACTGLIGSDGVCRECGKAVPFWGDERRRGMQDDPEAGEDDEDVDDEPRAARKAADASDERDDDDERALCPDGSCTGLLDADGRCKVCGKVDPDAVIAMRAAKADDADDEDQGGGEGGDEGGGDDAAADDDDRNLCPDGGCTGLIGSDGTCKVCGRRAED
jgi:hypothetical protein